MRTGRIVGLLSVAGISLLAGCSLTPEQAAGATVASATVVAQMLDRWLAAGILTPEQHAEAMATFQMFGASMQSVLELVRIWTGGIREAQAAAAGGVSTEGVVAISSGLTAAGVAATNMLRDRARIARHEPVGRAAKA